MTKAEQAMCVDNLRVNSDDFKIATEFLSLKEGVDFGCWDNHDWKKDENGNIDYFALDYECHNGPECLRCGFSFCHHCDPEEIDSCCEVKPPASYDRIFKVFINQV